MKASFAVLAVAVLFFTAFPLAAQVREEVTVEVVDVPVYVFSHGKPIANLTKDDFELFVNGKRQEIDYFDRIEFEAAPVQRPGEATPKAPTPVRDPRDRRLFLLLFDLANNRPPALARAQKAAVAMIDHALPQDFFAVATSSSTGGKFIIPFTRDRDVIRRAVIKLSPSSAHDSLAISITDAERQSTEAYTPIGRGDENPTADILALGATLERQRVKDLLNDQLADLSTLASRMTDLEGYKHVILFSEGFSSNYLTGSTPHLVPGTPIDTDAQ